MASHPDDPYSAEPRLATWDRFARVEPAVDDTAGDVDRDDFVERGGASSIDGLDERVSARRGAPLAVAAVVAAVWASLLGLLPVVALAAVVGIGSGATPVGVARISAGAWLLGHGAPVQTPADRITLVPLGLSVWIAWRLIRAGVHAARATGAHRDRSIWLAVRAGVAVAVAYGLVGAVIAELAATAEISVSPWRAAASCGLFAGIAATIGALGYGPAGRRLLRRLPRTLTDSARTGLAAAAFLIAAGAAAGGLALALAGGPATDMLVSFRAGVAGQAGITMLCLVFLPNLAIWGAAYLLGPGFAAGAGTVVSPGDVLLGPVPAVPVLAGLPSGPLSGIGPALLGVPLVAGLAAGILLARRSPLAERGWGVLLGAAALAGPVAGVVLQLAAFASSGALGSGRLSQLGPVDWRVGLFATGVVTVGTVFGAATARTLSRSPSL
jgi:Family of unknown function (DUF6350)